MRVLVTGGGTGGHVNPAIAIANTIKANIPDADIAFVGTKKGIENKLVPKEGYKLYHVEIQGIRRSLSLSNIKTAYLVFTSIPKAKKLIKQFKPDLVIGTGGFACWPVVKAAAKMGIPTAVHESNAVPGVTIKMLEKYVDKIYINFDETRKCFKDPNSDKIVRVGNPMKAQFATLDYTKAREQLGIQDKYKYFILSCGGSMGAERINEEILEVMKNFVSKNKDILHIHATGSIEYEIAKAKFLEYGLDKYDNIKLLEYIYDMPLQMAASDLVISRAGSMTLSELAILKKACILIPSPNVTNNHQYKNARVLEEKKAAILIEEKNLNSGKLENAIRDLLGNKDHMLEISENISKFAIYNTDKKIFNELINLVKI